MRSVPDVRRTYPRSTARHPIELRYLGIQPLRFRTDPPLLRRIVFGEPMAQKAIVDGALVQHSVWGRGKVLHVEHPYVLVYFPALKRTAQGPRRKLHLSAPQLSIADDESDPALDGVPVEDPRLKGRGRA